MEDDVTGGEPPEGSGAGVELRDGPTDHDQVPEVYGSGSADRQRSDGVDVQGDDAAHQGERETLGCRQRGEHHVAGSPGAKWGLESLLGRTAFHSRLSFPKNLPHPMARWSGRGPTLQ